ncbi:hypothetical protein WG66_007300 [Moniliophthora roreri]|nr:hypothetical protein WG66_007300 [Moniliophthora roreri]
MVMCWLVDKGVKVFAVWGDTLPSSGSCVGVTVVEKRSYGIEPRKASSGFQVFVTWGGCVLLRRDVVYRAKGSMAQTHITA